MKNMYQVSIVHRDGRREEVCGCCCLLEASNIIYSRVYVPLHHRQFMALSGQYFEVKHLETQEIFNFSYHFDPDNIPLDPFTEDLWGEDWVRTWA